MAKKKYTEKDLVAFGLYMVSTERKKKVSKINRRKVTDADVENFKEILKSEKEVVV